MNSQYLNMPWLLKRIFNRISGREARILFKDLEASRSEFQRNQSELRQALEALENLNNQYMHQRDARGTRIHPYVAEALTLAAEKTKTDVIHKSTVKDGALTGKFTKHGSDKETRHNYAETYSELLGQNPAPHILEIGLGSLNGFPYGGLPPGGSIKAWREGYPGALIVGADIDPQAVEAIDEIGFVVDQTSDQSLETFCADIAQYAPFDLVVDDGFHDPHANFRTFLKMFPLIKDSGAYVIEDIHESLIDFWKMLASTCDAKLQIRDLRADRPETDDNILLIFTKNGGK